MTDASRREFCQSLTACALSGAAGRSRVAAAMERGYLDGRPTATLRMDAFGAKRILRHGSGPDRCDYLGAREAICFRAGDTYYLYYDGAGPAGWIACLAVSKDLEHWELEGPHLKLGAPGERDAKTASSPWTVFDGTWWRMFYVGSQRTTPPPNRVPKVPYYALTAKSQHPDGPWIKLPNITPFAPVAGTYYADTASPGQIVRSGEEYLMFFSAAAFASVNGTRCLQRTLSIARTRNLEGSWQVDPQPILPAEQQVENSALYFEPSNQTWFLFTNHIGIDAQHGEYTESIWVYWSRNLERWDANNRAVVLDHRNCRWNVRCIGMPSVVKRGERLALFYDAPAVETEDSNMSRDLGIAWLKLPLVPPA